MRRLEVLLGLLDELLASLIIAGLISFGLYFAGLLDLLESMVLFFLLALPTLFLARKLLEAQEQPVKVGPEALVGKTADVLYAGKTAYVLIEGELWPAESSEELREGEKVVVVGRRDGKLIVKKA
ncbi:MAG: NfeD family protein [Acidilobaceae archaeon]|nr:NfeD family protein [Acidilobaceae archaeon]